MEITQVINGCMVNGHKFQPLQEDQQKIYLAGGFRKMQPSTLFQNRQSGGGIWVYDFSNQLQTAPHLHAWGTAALAANDKKMLKKKQKT